MTALIAEFSFLAWPVINPVVSFIIAKILFIVFDKTVVNPNDLTYLTNRYDSSVLTLQTCDPPGTLFKRLVVRAKLAGS